MLNFSLVLCFVGIARKGFISVYYFCSLPENTYDKRKYNQVVYRQVMETGMPVTAETVS